MGTFLSGSIVSLGLNRSDNDVTTVATSSLIDTLKTSAEEGVEFLGDMFTDIKEDVGDFIGNLGEEIDKACGKVSDSAKSALDTITEGWEKNALPTLKEAGTDILNILNDTAATVSGLVISIQEGVLRFGEALVDLGAIANTATYSIGTGIYDGYQALRGLVTGEEWESVTKAMWEGTKDFVATEHVKSLYDRLYNDTKFGKWIKENAGYGLVEFDTIRDVGSGIGYVAGIIALTVLTFGAGGAAVGATGAGTAAAGSTGIAAGDIAVIAGLAGTGKGAETAWKDGAGIGEGLLYAGANGAWEAFQFWAGAKIGSPGGLGDNIAKSWFNGSKAAGAFSRIVLDSADGGAEGFVQPFLKMLYKDTYTDENGNEVELDGNIIKRYEQLFNADGGFGNVGVQAAFGGALSLLGEVGNLRKLLKGEDNVRANPEPVTPKKANEFEHGGVSEVTADLSELPSKVREVELKIDGGVIEKITPERLCKISDEALSNPKATLKEVVVAKSYIEQEILLIKNSEPGISGRTLTELNEIWTKLDAREVELSAATKLRRASEPAINTRRAEEVAKGSSPDYVLGSDREALSHETTIERVHNMGIHDMATKSKYLPQIDALARKYGFSTTEMQEILDEKISACLQEGEFGRRTGVTTLEKCLDSGYVKNQFETGESGGWIGNSSDKHYKRANAEKEVFGISKSTPYVDRPVYGMLFPSEATEMKRYIESGPGDWYGNGLEKCVIIFNKDAVSPTASMTIGDSLDFKTGVAACPVETPKFSGSFPGIEHKFPTLEEFKKAKISELFTGYTREEYLEIQLHGQSSHAMTSSNIKEVVFSSTPSATLQEKLKSSGIPWRVL